MNKTIFSILLGTFLFPAFALAQITSLNGQTGSSQTFANDTNFTITSNSDVHTLGWNGLLSTSRGGTGADLSSFTTNSVFFNNGGVFGATLLQYDNSDPASATFSTPLGVTSSDPGVSFLLNAGMGGSTSGSGGSIYFTSGSAQGGNSEGGEIRFETGNGSGTSQAGQVRIVVGAAGENADGNFIGLQAGSGGSTSGNGGPIILQSGFGGGDSGNGGSIIFEAGGSQGGDGNGGIIELKPGLQNGEGTVGVIKFINPINETAAIWNTSELSTTDKIFTFPNANGTFSLLEVENTFTDPVNNFISDTDSTVHIGADGVPGCIAMGDSDGSGVTYITANNGVLSTSSTPSGNCN